MQAETAASFSPGQHPVKRRVTVNAPHQNGGTRPIKVNALPLPADPPSLPPKPNKSVKLIATVIEPEILFTDTNRPLTTFDPPLTITVEFTAEDVNAADKDSVGKPQLSIITFYQQGGAWKWERWNTSMTFDASRKTGTLTAQITTLRPGDPVAEGSP